MALQCGIVGLPNVGKSTLFNCLSNAKAQSANFPFCTIEPNLGVITVPDPRLNKLAELVKPKNLVPTTVEMMFGATQLMMQSIIAMKLESRRPDILLRPPVSRFRVLDFLKINAIMEETAGLKEELKRAIDAAFTAAAKHGA